MRSAPSSFASRSSLMIAVLSLASCTGSTSPPATERAITLRFEGRVGDAPFACGQPFAGIGSSGTELIGGDFRFYVHDVRVVTPRGDEVEVALTDDGVWQDDGIALLDFEDGDGCESGNAVTNVALVGTVPAGTTVAGVRFRIGVPEAKNHLDSSTQPSPLNLTAMYWSWSLGYKFLRVEGRTTGQPGGFLLHLGATECTGDARMGTRTCARGNRPEISLDAFDPERDVIVADLASLFSEIDLDVDMGGQPGCMSDIDDPDCTAMLGALGIGGTQRLFRVEVAE